VLLKGGIGNRGKTVRALAPTPGFVDASRFRTGAVRLILFFVTEEMVRGIIVYPSFGEARGWVPDASARVSGRKGEKVLDQEVAEADQELAGASLRYRLPASRKWLR